MEKQQKVLQSFITANRHDLALEFSRALRSNQVTASNEGTLVVAFDLRFNLTKPGYKYLYLLDTPFFDKNYELVKEDGTKELLTNSQATEILKEELAHNEEVIDKGDKAKEQLKKVSQFAKKGSLVITPPEPEPIATEEIDTAPVVTPVANPMQQPQDDLEDEE